MWCNILHLAIEDDERMNRQTVINKFIEKAGALDPKPHKHYIQGASKGWYGLTTQLPTVIDHWRNAFKEEFKKDYPNYYTLTVGQCLPRIHKEFDSWSIDFATDDILNCSRMLQNSPFKDVTVFLADTPTPIAFHRSGVDISILLAPYMTKIPDEEAKEIQSKKFKGNPWIAGKPNYQWVNQMPQSTFWLVEFPTHEDSFDANLYGYPIGRMLKCRNCGAELVIQDWINRKIRENHPECVCSCNTYDDFCGCQRMRESMVYDRLWNQQRQRKRFIKHEHS